MSKDTFYRQCRLVKKLPNSTVQQTTWLPEQFSYVGGFVRVKQLGEWSDGWQVSWASATKIAERLLPDSHKEIKGHRKATGDIND